MDSIDGLDPLPNNPNNQENGGDLVQEGGDLVQEGGDPVPEGGDPDPVQVLEGVPVAPDQQEGLLPLVEPDQESVDRPPSDPRSFKLQGLSENSQNSDMRFS